MRSFVTQATAKAFIRVPSLQKCWFTTSIGLGKMVEVYIANYRGVYILDKLLNGRLGIRTLSINKGSRSSLYTLGRSR